MNHATRAARRTRPVASEFAPWIAALQIWLGVGCLAVIVFPALRGVDAWFGWMPFWLVVAPALDLAVLRRRRLLAEAHTLLAHLRRRRRSLRQATPAYRHHVRKRRQDRAATQDPGSASPGQ
jgi:hypothetical protein